MSKARDLSNFISDATVDATEIADLAVTHAKLHTDMNLSSKTLTFAANQISGNSVDGGVISNFASTGIDDNASATAVTIISDGKVGIGITSPIRQLHLASSVPSIRLEDTDVSGAYNDIVHLSTGELSIRVDHGNVQSNSSLSFLIDADEKMRIDTSGNVGLGTNVPTTKLHVDGAGSQPELRVSQNSTYFTDYGVNHIDVNGPNDLRFLMGGSERARFKSGGDVSIGSDHSGFSGWRVLNMRQLSTGALINFEEDDGTRASTLAAWGSALRYQTHIAGGYHKFETVASTNALQINDNGHVVVNMHQFPSNPTGSKLNVFGDGEVLRLDGTGNTSRTLRFRGVSSANPAIIMADGSLEITNEDANTSIALLSERDITIKTTKSNGTAGHVKFYSYNTEIMRIDGSNNNVGIGTTSPDSLLHLQKTRGTISGGSSDTGAVLKLHTEAQWESGYGNNPAASTNDYLGSIEFSTGDSSTGEGVRAAIRATVDSYYNQNSIVFETATGATAVSPIERMRIDSSGHVTTPNVPAFLAFKSNGSVTSSQVVQWNNIYHNNGGNYSAATGKFTAPVAGYYSFTVGAIVGGSPVDGTERNGELQLQKNGSYYSRGHWNHLSRWENVSYTQVVYLAANDEVRVYFSDNTNNNEMYGASLYSHFGGFLIG